MSSQGQPPEPPDDDDQAQDPEEQPRLTLVHGKRKKGTIAKDQYEAMARWWLNAQQRSARGLARGTGVSLETARRAITRGWPERGWPSLMERANDADDRDRKIRDRVMTPEQAMNEAWFLARRAEIMNQLLAHRAVAAAALDKIAQAIGEATARRHAVRTWVEKETVGTGKTKRTVSKVLREDITLPPYLPHVLAAQHSLGGSIIEASAEEREWMQLERPTELPSANNETALPGATKEQVQYIIANNGKLPPGVSSLAELRVSKPPPKPGA